jgi:hypothetical protein
MNGSLAKVGGPFLFSALADRLNPAHALTAQQIH